MYVRKYNDSDMERQFTIPSNYDGTALLGALNDKRQDEPPQQNVNCICDTEENDKNQTPPRTNIKRENATVKVSPTAEAKEVSDTDSSETPVSARLNPWEIENDLHTEEASPASASGSSGIFSSIARILPLSNLFGGGGIGNPLSCISMPKLGTEELLLIGVALYLLLSKNGDATAALIILALLFVGN